MNSTCQRDKNHPAVLIWSLGNESFGGETLLQMAEMVRRFVDTRLVHYEGVVNDPRFLETTDIESHMYSTCLLYTSGAACQAGQRAGPPQHG